MYVHIIMFMYACARKVRVSVHVKQRTKIAQLGADAFIQSANTRWCIGRSCDNYFDNLKCKTLVRQKEWQ